MDTLLKFDQITGLQKYRQSMYNNLHSYKSYLKFYQLSTRDFSKKNVYYKLINKMKNNFLIIIQ